MGKDIKFEELGLEEKKLLLRAFDYDVDEEGYILNPSGNRIPSKEIPSKFLHVERDALVSGSLEVIDGTPTAISKLIRETFENQDGSKS